MFLKHPKISEKMGSLGLHGQPLREQSQLAVVEKPHEGWSVSMWWGLLVSRPGPWQRLPRNVGRGRHAPWVSKGGQGTLFL